MTCDEVREQLAEHLLGTLEPEQDDAVREHLRGCAGCRREMAALAEGVDSFALAAHDREPPPELRERVLTVLDDEWSATVAPVPLRRRPRWIAGLAAAAALMAALAWGGWSTVRAEHFEASAAKYEGFLHALGGENVRVGQLEATGQEALQGSVVMYDSNVGQSWVLVLCRAPGWSGSANIRIVREDGKTIDLHPMEFGQGGEGSTWLVTSADLRPFERVEMWNDTGVIATATVERD